MARPIRLKTHKVLIKAPREMIYQKMTSFGKGRLQGDNNESSRVISRDGNRIVAEFTTRAGPFTYTTLEQIDLEPPERITFNHVSGPLHSAWEQFAFKDVDGDTELVHSGEFVWRRIPLVGWLGGMLYTKRVFERVIEKHMEQIKVSCEARASRSHVFRRRQSAGTDP